MTKYAVILIAIVAGSALADYTDLRPGETANINGRQYRNDGNGVLRISYRWSLIEDSITPIGADQAAKFRSKPMQSKRGMLVDAINGQIDAIVTEEYPRPQITTDMAEAAGIDAAALDQVMTGETACPTRAVLEGFANALGIEPQQLIDAATEDGCEYPAEDATDQVAEEPAAESTDTTDTTATA
jgi:transcriptional regulator with XRE-family HTH domain